MIRTRWRYSWARNQWEPADAITRWVMNGACVRFETDGQGVFIRHRCHPVYNVDPPRGARKH